jgi:hypothetical protein
VRKKSSIVLESTLFGEHTQIPRTHLSKRRLAVIDVSDRPNVHVRLGPIKLLGKRSPLLTLYYRIPL